MVDRLHVLTLTAAATGRAGWHLNDVWVTGALLAAVAVEVALLDWVTLPFEPGLSTRTEMFELLGSTCSADDAADAACWVWAS